MVAIETIMAYEDGALDAEATIHMFAELIRSGDAWRLQGSYGRTAAALIRNGCISEAGVVDEDLLAEALQED